MVEFQCPICSVQSVPFLQAKDYNRHISAEVFSYHKCPACELIYLVNVPKDLGKYYPADYYAIPKSRELLLAKSAEEQYKVEIIQQFINKGRLLEIGPAWGTFAYRAKQSGFDVDVIEMDKQCCHFIQNELGIRAIQSNNPEAALCGLPGYNVITLWHVIEHLPDPWSILKSAADRLLPGGILVISTPNPAAFQFRILGRFWTHLDAPRHLALIPNGLLVRQMQAIRFKCVFLTATDKGSLGCNSFGWAVSLKNLFKHQPFQSAAHLAGRLLAKVLILIERSGLRGSTYTAIFRKS